VSETIPQSSFQSGDLACRPEPGDTESLAVFTLVVWLTLLLVGALGFVLRYERPQPPMAPEPPIVAQPLQVELAPDPLPPPGVEPLPPDPLAPPPPPDALIPPSLAQPIAVAQPSPAIAFALPIEGPTRMVEAAQAEYARRPAAVTNAAPAAPAAQPLTLGEGEGKQPAPEYPRWAVRQGQEGTVLVRLTVGENGRVQSAEAALPSPWPLLNEAALRTVRERWRFRSGPVRVYEVSIRFEITK
jgi:protein TonB